MYLSFSSLSWTPNNSRNYNPKKMKIFVALTSFIILVVFAAAVPQDYKDEVEMQKMGELASRKAAIQSALKQALIQSALEDEDDTSLQNILAKAEQEPDDDDLNRAQLLKLIASAQSPEARAHAQRWWRKVWHGVKKFIKWIG